MTHRETFAAITELTGAALTIKGYHYEKGQPIPEGERKLYLLLEGPTELSVKRAKVRQSCQSCACSTQAPKSWASHCKGSLHLIPCPQSAATSLSCQSHAPPISQAAESRAELGPAGGV
jgi:hypothetical protein